MAMALAIALEMDGDTESFHWQIICGEAVAQLNCVGLKTYTSKTGKAIRDWFVIF